MVSLCAGYGDWLLLRFVLKNVSGDEEEVRADIIRAMVAEIKNEQQGNNGRKRRGGGGGDGYLGSDTDSGIMDGRGDCSGRQAAPYTSAV